MPDKSINVNRSGSLGKSLSELFEKYESDKGEPAPQSSASDRLGNLLLGNLLSQGSAAFVSVCPRFTAERFIEVLKSFDVVPSKVHEGTRAGNEHYPSRFRSYTSIKKLIDEMPSENALKEPVNFYPLLWSKSKSAMTQLSDVMAEVATRRILIRLFGRNLSFAVLKNSDANLPLSPSFSTHLLRARLAEKVIYFRLCHVEHTPSLSLDDVKSRLSTLIREEGSFKASSVEENMVLPFLHASFSPEEGRFAIDMAMIPLISGPISGGWTIVQPWVEDERARFYRFVADFKGSLHHYEETTSDEFFCGIAEDYKKTYAEASSDPSASRSLFSKYVSELTAMRSRSRQASSGTLEENIIDALFADYSLDRISKDLESAEEKSIVRLKHFLEMAVELREARRKSHSSE